MLLRRRGRERLAGDRISRARSGARITLFEDGRVHKPVAPSRLAPQKSPRLRPTRLAPPGRLRPATFVDETYGSPNYTSARRRLLPSKWYIISTPAQFSCTIDGTGADSARSEGGKRILLDNSRVYVRFLPFVSGRVHLGRLDDSEHD